LDYNRIRLSEGVGVRLLKAMNNELTKNTVAGDGHGLSIEEQGWPNALWWNNFELSEAAVLATMGPLELSSEGRGNWWGHACPGDLFLPLYDSDRADVQDSFAYGRRSWWLFEESPGCDVEAPPPVRIYWHRSLQRTDLSTAAIPAECREDACPSLAFLWPLDGSVSDGRELLLFGVSEAGSAVTILEGEQELGQGSASEDGLFYITLATPLSLGEHALTAVATDLWENRSEPSSTLRLTVEEAPFSVLEHPSSKVKLLGLEESQRVFVVGEEQNRVSAHVDVKAVKGLNGNAKKHRFLAVMRRTIREPGTQQVLASVFSMTEVDRATASDLWVREEEGWDGRGWDGGELELGRVYPYELELVVLRVVDGAGSGSMDEIVQMVNLGDYLPQLLETGLAERYDPSLVVGEVATDDPNSRTVSKGAAPVGSAPPSATQCARSCWEGKQACSLSSLTNCTECMTQCAEDCDVGRQLVTPPLCDWPHAIQGSWERCDYWNDSFVPIVRPCFVFHFDETEHRPRSCSEAYDVCLGTSLPEHYPDRCEGCRDDCHKRCHHWGNPCYSGCEDGWFCANGVCRVCRWGSQSLSDGNQICAYWQTSFSSTAKQPQDNFVWWW
jgi:hypothetical protein